MHSCLFVMNFDEYLRFQVLEKNVPGTWKILALDRILKVLLHEKDWLVGPQSSPARFASLRKDWWSRLYLLNCHFSRTKRSSRLWVFVALEHTVQATDATLQIWNRQIHGGTPEEVRKKFGMTYLFHGQMKKMGPLMTSTGLFFN